MAGKTRTAHRTCPLCEATCGLELTIDASQKVKVIRGDRENPFSNGFICPKGTVLGKLHADPDRLRQPLVKRSGEHVAVSWPEAFAAVKQGLDDVKARHGNQALAMYLGNPNVHNFQNTLSTRSLTQALGSRNIFSASTLDQMPRHVSSGYMFGSAGSIAVPDIDRTDLLVILGANPYESNGSLATAPDWPGRIEAIRRRGGKVIVVDPRRTKTAEHSDQHIPIVPGSDAALLMSIINVLFEDDLVDLGALEGKVEGMETVATKALGFAPESVAAVTGVGAETIRQLAHDIAAAPSASVYGRMGTHTAEFGTISSWACDVISVLTSNLDSPGGMMFPMALHQGSSRSVRGFQTGRWASRVRGLPEVLGELPSSTMIDEMSEAGDGQIKALITVGGNPALTAPDSEAFEVELDSLEFMVSIDPYLNETTRHADVILPPPSTLEKSHYDLAFTTLSVRNYAMWSPEVFSRPASQPSEFEILVTLTAILSGGSAHVDAVEIAQSTLAARVQSMVSDPTSIVHGKDADEILSALDVHAEVPERFLDLMIRTGHLGDGFGQNPDGWSLQRLQQHPHGVDFGPLQPRIPEALSTPSGRVELAPVPIVEDIARLEQHVRDFARPEFVLVGRRDLRSNNSWLHNIEVLVKGKERCTLRLHPEDAKRLDLADGSMARVSSAAGELKVTVEINDEMMVGVVSLPYGWGHDREGSDLGVASRRPGVNSNILTDRSRVDPISGNAVLNGIPVEISVA